MCSKAAVGGMGIENATVSKPVNLDLDLEDHPDVKKLRALRKWRILSHLPDDFLLRTKLFYTTGCRTAQKIAFIVTADDEVYALGPNDKGYLGIGKATGGEFQMVPQRVSALCGKGVIGITAATNCRNNSSLYAWTSDGSVFSLGYNAHGQLGHGDTNPTTTLNTPTLIDHFRLKGQKIIQVAAAVYHAIALTETGQVWSWGSNGYGELGNGNKTASRIPIKPTRAFVRDFRIVAVDCGGYSSAALSAHGEIFTWGRNTHGQLGLGHRRNMVKPTKIIHGIKFSKMTCGRNYMLALSTTGELFAWGCNIVGELGVGDRKPRTSPTPVAAKLGNVVDILTSSVTSTTACKTSESIFIWGEPYINAAIENPLEIEVQNQSVYDTFSCFLIEQVTPKILVFSISTNDTLHKGL